MSRLLALAVVSLALIGVQMAPVDAIEPPTEVISIELSGDESTRFEVDGRRYAGPIVFTARPDGVAFTESATIEQYLEGIAEMPFLWPSGALAAQAVAARTYLARTLLGGRSGNETVYGFDICATSACQVYRGVGLVEGDYGDRWKEAVQSTAGEILIYNGRPAETVYSAIVGSRTLANQDVWPSSEIPYLQPVDSPEIGIAPYAEWVVEITGDQFVAILAADGYDVQGSLESIVVNDPPEGEGRSTLIVSSTGGTDSLLGPSLKGAFNIRGHDLFPGILPVRSISGNLYPQSLLSYSYQIHHERAEPGPLDEFLPFDDRAARDIVRIEGEGWGHGVGMSQWGAKIMADAGATYGEILSHYYTGLEPLVAPLLVPSHVVVGLDWGRETIPVTIIGPARVSVNGVPFTYIPAGEWEIRSTSLGVELLSAGAVPGDSLVGDRHWPR